MSVPLRWREAWTSWHANEELYVIVINSTIEFPLQDDYTPFIIIIHTKGAIELLPFRCKIFLFI